MKKTKILTIVILLISFHFEMKAQDYKTKS